MSPPPRASPALPVRRVPNRHGDRFWFYDQGRRISISPALALQSAARGEVKISTPSDRR